VETAEAATTTEAATEPAAAEVAGEAATSAAKSVATTKAATSSAAKTTTAAAEASTTSPAKAALAETAGAIFALAARLLLTIRPRGVLVRRTLPAAGCLLLPAAAVVAVILPVGARIALPVVTSRTEGVGLAGLRVGHRGIARRRVALRSPGGAGITTDRAAALRGRRLAGAVLRLPALRVVGFAAADITRAAACDRKNIDFRFTWITSSQSCSVNSKAGARRMIPALLTRMFS